jgi:WD40 repeat protein
LPVSLKQADVLATGSEDAKVRVFNARSGKLQGVISGHEARIKAISGFDFNGTLHFTVASSDGSVYVWSICENSLLRFCFSGR